MHMDREHAQQIKGRVMGGLMVNSMQSVHRPIPGLKHSLATQTLSVPQRRSLSVCVPILKAIGAAGRKGSGLRDYLKHQV